MKRFRKVVFVTFLISTLATLAFAFWFFSGQPSQEQMAKAFPLNSYQTFTGGKKLTLYSIEPKKIIENAETFHDYSVIGKTDIHDGSFQRFLKHVFLNDSSARLEGAVCFNPRHGLRVSDGEKTVDILICYECRNFATFYGNEKGTGGLMGTSQILFNKALSDAGIKLAEN